MRKMMRMRKMMMRKIRKQEVFCVYFDGVGSGVLLTVTMVTMGW